MKILHCCLSQFYIDNYSYQENILPRVNKQMGHEVKIIASTETYLDNRNLEYVEPSRYYTEDGIEIVRLPYRKALPHKFMRKIRSYKGVTKEIEKFSPDVILHHGVPAYELLTFARYKMKNPNIRLYVDSHEDFHNSARNFLSREILHRRFYKPIVQKALPYIDKILCVSLEVFDFLEQLYEIPRSIMEFYPLGGIVVDGIEHQQRREKIRLDLGLGEDDVLFVHSGKMNRKKRTEDLLRAFSAVKSKKLRLILIGNLDEEIEKNVKALISQDDRVSFIGWKTGNELIDYLCACDMYLQPGTQSATLQNAICTGCPVMLYPYESHRPYLKDNGFFVQTVEDMIDVFLKIESNPSIIEDMRVASYKVAYDILDYKKLAARLYR